MTIVTVGAQMQAITSEIYTYENTRLESARTFGECVGNVHAQSLRSGGCSDLYGTAPAPAVQPAQDKLSDNEAVSRVHLVGFGHHGHHGGHSCLFKRGGCSVGSCGAPVPYGLPAAGFYSAPLVANQQSTFYQAPTYFQAPGHHQGHGFEYSTVQHGGYYQAPGFTSCKVPQELPSVELVPPVLLKLTMQFSTLATPFKA